MKKLMKMIMALGLIAGALMTTGCSEKTLDIDKHVQNKKMVNELEGAPSWVMSHPDNDNYIFGLGVASPTAGDIAFQRTVAIGEGRDEIARSVSTKVKNMLKSFKEKTGTLDDTTFDRVATNVSKQVANSTLIGSSQYKDNWWISKNGNLYILVALPKENAKKAILSATNSSFKNNKAMWQKFQAKQAQDELKAEVEAQF